MIHCNVCGYTGVEITNCPGCEIKRPASLETKPCIICEKPLTSMFDTWDTMQPDGGGEVKLVFSWGSNKFDGSIFKGVICDECASNCVNTMERGEYW